MTFGRKFAIIPFEPFGRFTIRLKGGLLFLFTESQMSKEEGKLTPEEVMQSLQDHEEGCEKRQKVTNKGFDKLEERFDRLEERFDRLEGRFDRLERRFDRLERRFDRLEDKVDRINNWLLGLAGMILASVGVNIAAMAYFTS